MPKFYILPTYKVVIDVQSTTIIQVYVDEKPTINQLSFARITQMADLTKTYHTKFNCVFR